MIEIRIPKLGLTMENAIVAGWHAADGAPVVSDDLLLTIETDKLTFDVPAPTDGILVHMAAKGAVCAVEEVVGYLAQSRAEYDRLRQPPSSRQTPAPAAAQAAVTLRNTAGRKSGVGRIKASPLARAMAAQRGLDLAGIAGTGPDGRIVRADILRSDEPSAAPADAQARQDHNPVLRRIPITGARRRIFENMRRSLADTAQFSLHTEADASGVLRLRRQLKDRGLQISYNAMLIKIAAAALQKHRQINVSVGDGNQILVWERINIGLAMHIDDTLVVPVFRSPGALSLRQLNTQINACMRRIKRKCLTPDELSGGTFTITNLGFADVDHFTPILRPPESAVLGIGRIVEKAVVCQGQVVARPQLGLSLTVDHRIIDGAPAARFLHTIKQMVENPAPVV